MMIFPLSLVPPLLGLVLETERSNGYIHDYL